MRLRLFLLLMLFTAALGCTPPAPQQAVIPIPTRALLPSNYQLEGAERVAREFLMHWREGDLAAMHSLLSFNARDAYPLDTFTSLYTTAHETMTLDSLTIIDGSGIFRQQESVALFNYNVNFHTRMVGDFSSGERNLTLIVDDRADDWRVAWTPDDIFPGMASGARLRIELNIPNRANIYDTNGDVLADQNGRIVLINVIRQRIPDYPNCLNALSAALDQPAAEVQARLEARPADWLMEVGTIEAQTYIDTHAQLEQFCDAQFNDRPVRRYPNGTVAPHILGYVGYPDETSLDTIEAAGFNQASILGRSGIELTWDTTLRGQPGGRLTIVSPTGESLRELARSSPQPGESLWLTLDAEFQAQTQQIVADAYTQAKDSWAPGSAGTSVVVMDVNTGAIRAMVSYPTFDNNAYNVFPSMGREEGQRLIQAYQSDERHPEVNRPVQGLYPLGSVMKTVSATAAADSGVYALDERYTCTGIWNRDITRYDWNSGHGTLTLAGSLTQSCNPYYYEVGYQLDQVDPWILPTYARRLGFGGSSGLTDLVEETGFVPDPDWMRQVRGETWTFSESVNMAIGQGFLQVTPLQVARWFSAIANGGSLPRPHLVEQIGLLGETLRPAYEPELTPTGVRAEVLDVIRRGTCDVTTVDWGTATFVFRNSPLQSIGVCGKTGTAQTGGPGTPSHAWFAAYAPRDNPQVAIVVMVETAGQGSEVAAPIARQVLEAYFGMTP